MYTAHELAAMPVSKARRALVQQECAYMQARHARRVLAEVEDLGLDFTVGRVLCFGIDGRQFTWEAHEACGLCGDTGELIGTDNKAYDCPVCEDLVCETFSTDYDGNIIGGG